MTPDRERFDRISGFRPPRKDATMTLPAARTEYVVEIEDGEGWLKMGPAMNDPADANEAADELFEVYGSIRGVRIVRREIIPHVVAVREALTPGAFGKVER